MNYERAAICLNGDIITSCLRLETDIGKFCTICGAEIITTCPSCNSPIHGREKISPWVRSPARYALPMFCHNCGKAYPWTQAELDKVNKLINEEMPELSLEEKSNFRTSLPKIMSNTSLSRVAATQVSKYLKKITPTVQETFKQIFYRLAADGAKALIWGL
ncbi:MAG: DUF2321 domain-containing protein [Selenomonadaceae bacterium]|nr:DUF2321 domain-containing protein [Selenomonadaceae bacterium]